LTSSYRSTGTQASILSQGTDVALAPSIGSMTVAASALVTDNVLCVPFPKGNRRSKAVVAAVGDPVTKPLSPHKYLRDLRRPCRLSNNSPLRHQGSRRRFRSAAQIFEMRLATVHEVR
jgi:hypothetical protein